MPTERREQESRTSDRTKSLSSPGSLRRLWPFGIWLLVFYSVWLLVVIVGDHWQTVQSHWPIAVAMSFGSYIAGSTPMGGGTVGFPVLVLLFELPGSLGRNFGLAVQSIGMLSASIYIFSARRPLDLGLLWPGLLGALIGTPLGAAYVAPFVPDLWVKLTFAVTWCSFGMMHLMKLNELVNATGESDRWRRWDRPIGLTIGFAGGVVASVCRSRHRHDGVCHSGIALSGRFEDFHPDIGGADGFCIGGRHQFKHPSGADQSSPISD